MYPILYLIGAILVLVVILRLLGLFSRGQVRAAARRGKEPIMAGRSDELKGGLKEGRGKLTGDEGLEAEGTAQKTGGRARRKVSGTLHETAGGLKHAAGDALDSPTLEAEGKAERA